jgi:hypothetical protein
MVGTPTPTVGRDGRETTFLPGDNRGRVPHQSPSRNERGPKTERSREERGRLLLPQRDSVWLSCPDHSRLRHATNAPQIGLTRLMPPANSLLSGWFRRELTEYHNRSQRSGSSGSICSALTLAVGKQKLGIGPVSVIQTVVYAASDKRPLSRLSCVHIIHFR